MSIKHFVRSRPHLLHNVLNLLDIFECKKRCTRLKCKFLRFCGAKIGQNVYIGSDFFVINPQNLTIGNNCIINNNNSLCCWNRINIGDNSFTSINVTFVAGSHDISSYADLCTGQDISVESGCWIGVDATVLGGAVIGRGCIVGAKSLILGRQYEQFSVLAGVPAKKIKIRTPAKVIKQPIEYTI